MINVKELAALEAAKYLPGLGSTTATELLGAIRLSSALRSPDAHTITVKADCYARLGELKDCQAAVR